MKKTIGWLAVVVLAIGAAAFFYLRQQQPAPAPQPQALPPVEMPSPPVTEAEPAIRYPLPEEKEAGEVPSEPLPVLNESDQALRDALSGLLGREWFSEFFLPQEIVRRIVVTIDNLPRQKVALQLLPVKPVGGKFLTAEQGNNLVIAENNAARYTRYVRIAETIDPEKLVSLYIRFYPLFQRAYQDLGYPNAYFNDRLIAVIDHLLDAPGIEGSVPLTQPHVLYRFADPDLQAASAGHKIMLRMGSDNAEKIKRMLREIRRELTGRVLKK